MTALQLLLLSVSLSGLAGLGSLCATRHDTAAIRIASLGGLVAALPGIVAGIVALSGTTMLEVASPYPFARFILRLDPLSGLMVAVISTVTAIASLYGLAYLREYAGRGIAAMGFFFNLFVAAMLLVVTADNALWFLVFFEMMTLASYFLVIFNQDADSVSAGFIYFLMAHAGSVAIMAAFFLMSNAAGGSFDFSAFRAAHPSAGIASLAFVLALLGFGAKAGMIPLHVWLPRAHPAAPSHASALMSGVMIKIGVFGILKVGVDLLGGGPAWWGLLVLGFGAVSSLLGVVYALVEHDIKRLLAYHSVENIGIILLGVGTGMLGLSEHRPLIAVLGLMAGLYHLVNHAIFKALLFLGAGAVIHRMDTKNIEQMGGLARTMPWTSLCFLVGALAISAIPPLNGFVSEWFTYQALFAAAFRGTFLVRLTTPVAASVLAMTGALAVMCFVKAYGEIFSGAPRSVQAEQAREVPVPMVAGMVILVLFCIGLGLAAPLVAPVIGAIAAATLRLPEVGFSAGAAIVPGDANATALSTPLLAALLVALAALPLLLSAVFRAARAGARRAAAPWACGYLPDSHMTVSAHSFAQPIRMFLAPLYGVHRTTDTAGHLLVRGFDDVTEGARRTEPLFDAALIRPLITAVEGIGHRVQRLQSGGLATYCLYIVAALVGLLIVALG